MIVEEIVSGIEAVMRLLSDLNAAKARAQAGVEMTSADRAALDAANALKADRVNALIDARIGPEAAEPAVGVATWVDATKVAGAPPGEWVGPQPTPGKPQGAT